MVPKKKGQRERDPDYWRRLTEELRAPDGTQIQEVLGLDEKGHDYYLQLMIVSFKYVPLALFFISGCLVEPTAYQSPNSWSIN